jgi:hypothetical protein
MQTFMRILVVCEQVGDTAALMRAQSVNSRRYNVCAANVASRMGLCDYQKTS